MLLTEGECTLHPGLGREEGHDGLVEAPDLVHVGLSSSTEVLACELGEGHGLAVLLVPVLDERDEVLWVGVVEVDSHDIDLNVV